jgi:hypothetical protein
MMCHMPTAIAHVSVGCWNRDQPISRVQALELAAGSKVTPSMRPMHLQSLTTPDRGRIDLRKIAPKARVD